MHACTLPYMYVDTTHLCRRLNPVKERPCVHHNDLDTFFPCNGSVLLQRCSGLLTETAGRCYPHRMPVFLRAWDWLASPLQNSLPRNHAELLLARVSKVRNRSLGSFIPALLRYFRHSWYNDSVLQPKGVVENLVKHAGWAAPWILSWDML